MVPGLKGQIFMLDLSLAFLILLMLFSFLLSMLWLSNKKIAGNYEEFIVQKKLLDASEKVMLDLAEYSENTIKHHNLSATKIMEFAGRGLEEIKRELLLENYNISIKLTTASGKNMLEVGESNGMSIKRVAVCGDELCVLEIRA